MLHRITNYITGFATKIGLVLTSFAPVVLVFGTSKAEYTCSLMTFLISLAISVFMCGVCKGIFFLLERYSPKEGIKITEIEHKRENIVAYIYLLLLPLIRDSDASFGSLPITTIFCIIIFVAAIIDVGLYYFNPVIRLFGYRVYSIKIKGREGTLIAKTKYPLSSVDIGFYETRNISFTHKIYLYRKDRGNDSVQ